ncbi:MAG TPA: hypothetical protein VJU86_23330 [Pyrinomonadaceae bacterium]|nr:hypothetical protein [Pyrinomonadaceae bacterium]
MKKNRKKAKIEFKIVCIACGGTIREKASEDAYGLCLRCFYNSLALRFQTQKRAVAGEFVSER